MEEQYISFEIAKLAKEKRFGMTDDAYLQLPTWYNNKGDLKKLSLTIGRKYNPSDTHLGADTINDFKVCYGLMDNSSDKEYLAPTQSLLAKYIREIHNLDIIISSNLIGYGYIIYNRIISKNIINCKVYETYEESLEEALFEALNLVKND